MLRMTRVLGNSIAVLVLAGAMAPTAANASPLGKLLHLHPGSASPQDSRISVSLYNKDPEFKDVKIGGQVYTVLPHASLTVKAPAGTAVYVESTGFGHHKGDMLFAVTSRMQGTTVSLD